jgi:transcriptional regulator with XRE-family HTH domain
MMRCIRHIRHIMKLTSDLTDESILRELGDRLSGARLEQNMTQAALAERAGVSKRTVERLESGEVATQLSGFVRVCRALGLVERLELLVPEPAPSPMAMLRLQRRRRRRASGKKGGGEQKPWSWGEPT